MFVTHCGGWGCELEWGKNSLILHTSLCPFGPYHVTRLLQASLMFTANHFMQMEDLGCISWCCAQMLTWRDFSALFLIALVMSVSYVEDFCLSPQLWIGRHRQRLRLTLTFWEPETEFDLGPTCLSFCGGIGWENNRTHRAEYVYPLAPSGLGCWKCCAWISLL